MTSDYLALYEQLVEREPLGQRRRPVPRVVGSLAADEPARTTGIAES